MKSKILNCGKTFLILSFLLNILNFKSLGFDEKLSAKSAVLYEPYSKSFLFSKNADEKLPMASTTKIMTALLAIENCELDETVKVPKEVVGVEGSSLYLKENDILTVGDCVFACLLQSANDASLLLALKIGGDVENFSRMMNKRAKDFGALDTNFVNPHGLDDNEHYTTAKDLAKIAGEAMKNPIFRKIVSTYKYSFLISDCERTVVNHNKLLRKLDFSIGVKTGYTKKCGRCLVGAFEKDGLTLISVTLNAPDDWRDHEKLANFGYENYKRINIDSIAECEFNIPVISGSKNFLNAKIENDCIPLVCRKNENPFSCKIYMKRFAVAPINIGDKIGEIVVEKNGQVIEKIAILSTENIKKSNKFKE